ncbi:MAG: YidB family protein, partial [Stenotrophobium sp.]
NNLGANNPQQGQLLQGAMQLMQQQGGLTGVLDKFRQQGFAQHVESWIGNGANLPIETTAITQVLGAPAIAGLAQKFGLNPQQLSGQLATVLPQLVNHLTPQGQVPANHADLLQAGLNMLTGK